ncbi:translational activator of cytochrome c oxidase 1 [Linepithema humile]|uniref:translational activator of cytochrome c oxidase 1 n=1 Tax=Linepithema humile TaxID=83485 RepID=UPI000622FEDF|nr:PREDICTED: translational activator of cytochrome c oxidase 1 [Linepithema humile]
MTQLLNRLRLNRSLYFLSKDSKRFAGHSKWMNIKHTKEEKDNEKKTLFHHFTSQMTVAIRQGGSTKLNENAQLARLVEIAKKANMPVATIKNFLEKMESRKNKTQTGIIEVRGPSGYFMLIRYTTDNTRVFEMNLNIKLKKTRGKTTDTSVRKMFTHIGNIIVEKKGNLEQATEDAIVIGAEDVEEFEENDTKYFQFKCDPKLISKIKNLLEGLQYCVLSAEEDYIPKVAIELNESDLEAISCIREKVLSLDDVDCLYDNAA